MNRLELQFYKITAYRKVEKKDQIYWRKLSRISPWLIHWNVSLCVYNKNKVAWKRNTLISHWPRILDPRSHLGKSRRHCPSLLMPTRAEMSLGWTEEWWGPREGGTNVFSYFQRSPASMNVVWSTVSGDLLHGDFAGEKDREEVM